MAIRFEWDPVKADANVRKHGVSFATATLAFNDRFAIVEQDRVEDGEYRWRTIGMADAVTLLIVAHTLIDDDRGELVRIVSARRAEKSERRRYEEEAR